MFRKDGFDEFGNPVGRAFDLGGVDDSRLKGEKILFYIAYDGTKFGEQFEWHLAQQAVAERSLHMDIVVGPSNGNCTISEKMLGGYSQLWYSSDNRVTLSKKQTQMIQDFVDAGNGLLLWADNEPFFADANLLAKKIVRTTFSGNKPGGRILLPGDKLEPGYFIEHPLTQGINNLFEGITICTIARAANIKILAQSHDKQLCMGCYDEGGKRVVLDTGFTKLIQGQFYKTAGTARYFRNIAFWLSRGARNVEYKSFTPGRESLATIDPGGTSERYKYTVTQSANLSYILHWEGTGALGLAIQDPKGRIVYDTSSAKAPIRVDLTASIPGDYLCWVKGVNVPKTNFPYVLTLVLHKVAVSAAPVTVSSSATVSNTIKRLPIYMVVDGSNRANDYALNLDLGVRTLADRLRGRKSKGASTNIWLILADEDGQQSDPLTEIERFTLPKLMRRGKCGLGRALAKVNASISSKPLDGKPLVIVVLTGAPDDDWAGQANHLHNLAAQGKANVFVIGVGGYNDPVTLKRLTTSTPLILPVLTQIYAQQTFEWLYQIADVVLDGMESGASGQSRSVPPPPVCLKAMF